MNVAMNSAYGIKHGFIPKKLYIELDKGAKFDPWAIVC